VYDEAGLRKKNWSSERLKNNRRGRIKVYAEKFKGVVYSDIDSKADFNPLWAIPADCAFPCATQNEIQAKDAQGMVKEWNQASGRRRKHANPPGCDQYPYGAECDVRTGLKHPMLEAWLLRVWK